jgi:hypothetical protein
MKLVTGPAQFFTGLFGRCAQLTEAGAASCSTNPLTHMKNDYSFKLVAAIVFLGVIVALVSPSHSTHQTDATSADSVPTATHTE